MRTTYKPRTAGVAAGVRTRIERGGERLWRVADFPELSPLAVSQTLRRLEPAGVVSRVRNGLYYRGRQTVVGPSRPSAGAIAARVLRSPLHPAGLTAANLLGLTTQNPARPEYVTVRRDRPSVIRGAIVHVRRPQSRLRLSMEENAFLEILRERGRSSDLQPRDTVRRLTAFIAAPATFKHLVEAALEEPPRVRAMLGALGQEARADPKLVARLRRTLNPISKFDFGALRAVKFASSWQAR